MMRFIILMLLNLSAALLLGQKYAVSEIPADLLEGADAVVRKHEGYFEILARNAALYREHKVVTVFDEAALRQAVFVAFYDNLSKLKKVDFKVYDKNGKLLHKAKKGDLKDEAAIGEASLYADHRVKYYESPLKIDCPYTIEYSYEKRYDYLFHIPDWHFVLDEGIATEASSFSFKYPKSVGGRYKEHNFDGKKDDQSSKNHLMYVWSLEHQQAMEGETYSVDPKSILPWIQLSPEKFEYESYKGNLSTWDEFAAWIHQLNQALNPLPKAFVKELKEKTAGKTDLEKAKWVYEYLQNNSRYVSIQLGVGGYQPFSPEIVHKNGYGDCKALTFYTKSMMEAVGLKAYYALVKAGGPPDEIDRSFPSNSFNHVILYLPLEKDSIWLECTSQTTPFGYLGSFTSDREALLIKEDARAEILPTASYSPKENYLLTKGTLELKSDGTAQSQFLQRRQALMMDALSDLMEHKEALQSKRINNYFDWANIDIEAFELEHKATELILEMELKHEHLLTKSAGERLLLTPNIFSKSSFVPAKNKDRQTDILIQRGYHKEDSLIFILPKNLEVDLLFEPIEINSNFGKYSAAVQQLENGDLLYTRSFYVQNGQFPAEEYQDFYKFYKAVKRADKKIIALRKIP